LGTPVVLQLIPVHWHAAKARAKKRPVKTTAEEGGERVDSRVKADINFRVYATSVMMIPMLVFLLVVHSDAAGPADPKEQASTIIDGLAFADGPGIQYVLVNKDRVLFQKSAGLADIKAGVPVTDSTVMAAFSMTKTITAIAVLQLQEKGKLSIDDRVAKYVRHPYHQELTIRQLLTHTGGIPNPMPLKWVHLAAEEGSFRESAALEAVLREHGKPPHGPGEVYEYSNIGYWLLGKVIEKASDQDYGTYVTKHIFHQLGLGPKEIGFCRDIAAPRSKGYLSRYSFLNLVKGFVTDREVWGEYEGSWLHVKDVCVNGPAFGGAFGTARAFSRVLQDLLSDQSKLLGRAGKELLFTQEKTASGKPVEMTPGWHIDELNGGPYFYKEGGGVGFHSEMRIYPRAGLASIIMTNRTEFNSRKRLTEVDQVFLRQRQ
jgi:D-alanyl-D-alanine carboxypeptidase